MSDQQLDESSIAGNVAAIIERLSARADDVIGAIQQHLAAQILELRGDAHLLDLLRASVAGNIETVFDLLRHGIAIERVEPPTAALEYARRLAQRGIPVNALVRAYRLGQQQLLAHVRDEIARSDLEPSMALPAFDKINGITFDYIDWISQQVTTAYETERERWVENRNSVRAVRVRELLDAPDIQVDIDAATAAIRYPLRQHHIAVILWVGQHDTPGSELLRLERFLRQLAEAMKLRDGPLFVAADRVSAWGWLPLATASEAEGAGQIREFACASDDVPFIAAGTAQAGIDGFRRSHHQAQNARRVAVAGSLHDRITLAGDPGVGTAALLSQDLPQTCRWVGEILGPLAGATDSDARLRETLRVFLRKGGSYKAAAEHLNLHHNSVRYRVQRALERRGRPLDDDRIDVELALLACHHFGTTVLTTTAAG